MHDHAVSLEGPLRALLDKELVREVLYTACRALDRSDLELLKSVYHPEGFNVHGPL